MQDDHPPIPEHVSAAITDFLHKCFKKVCEEILVKPVFHVPEVRFFGACRCQLSYRVFDNYHSVIFRFHLAYFERVVDELGSVLK